MLLPQLQALLTGTKNEANPRELTLEKRYAYAHGAAIDADLKYYRGLMPLDEDKAKFLKVVRTGDKIGPAIDRFVAGVLALDPEWTIKRSDSDVTSDLLGTPLEVEASPEDKQLAGELNALEDTLTVWDKSVRLHQKMRELYRISLWAEKGYPRLYIPDSEKDNPKVQGRSFETIEEALTVVYLNILDPRVAGRVESEHGDTLGYFYHYADEDGKSDLIELHTPTQIKTVRFSAGKIEEELEGDAVSPPNPLYREGERPDYLMATLEHPTGGVLDESIIDEQDSLNESKVEMRRNGYMGGHRQYITVNAADPVDAAGNATLYKFGPSVVANIQGVDIWSKDINGNDVIVGKTTPQVIVVEPVDPDNFIKAIHHHTQEILQKVSQAHFEGTFLAISGESKRESKEAWLSTLELDSGPVGEVYAHILRNALRLAYWLTGKEDNAFDVYEVVPSLNLNVSNSDITTLMNASDLVSRGHMTLDRFVAISDLVKNKEAELATLNQVETVPVEVEVLTP